MREELFMSVETGELLTATEAIKDYYSSHTYMDDWTEAWKPTGMYLDEPVACPDFGAAISV